MVLPQPHQQPHHQGAQFRDPWLRPSPKAFIYADRLFPKMAASLHPMVHACFHRVFATPPIGRDILFSLPLNLRGPCDLLRPIECNGNNALGLLSSGLKRPCIFCLWPLGNQVPCKGVQVILPLKWPLSRYVHSPIPRICEFCWVWRRVFVDIIKLRMLG